MGNLRKLSRYLVSGRFGDILNALQERIPKSLFYYGKAYIFELKDRPEGPLPDLPDGYIYRKASRNDVPALSRASGVPADEYYRRLGSGDVCYGVFTADGAASLYWVHQGPCYVRGMGFTLRSESFDNYLYGIVTNPTERGKGLYQKGLVHLAAHLYDNGSTKLIQMTEEGNAPVLHILPKLGYCITMVVKHCRLLGFKYTTVIDLVDNRTRRSLFIRRRTGYCVI